MFKKTFKTLQDEVAIRVFKRFSRRVGKRIPFLALVSFVFLPICVESSTLPFGQKVSEFQSGEFMLFYPLNWHADFFGLLASHVKPRLVKGAPELIGGIVEASDSVSPDGKPITSEQPYETKEEAVWCGKKKLSNQFPSDACGIHDGSDVVGGILGIVTGIALLKVYYWIKFNLT